MSTRHNRSRSYIGSKITSAAGTLKSFSLSVGIGTLRRFLALLSSLISLFVSSKRSTIPPIDDQILITPAVELSKQIKSGLLTAEEVVQSYITRIKQVNPLINSIVDKRFELALKEAREIDRRITEARNGKGDSSILELPLVGVPVSVKETIAVEGYSNSGGLASRKSIKAAKSADVVELLQDQGLIVIGLTNIPELSLWWDSDNPVYGKTLNPYDLSRIPGGSSGGEAATIAAAASVIGVGSDIAGSIRLPANFCGVFGHKPTPFIVPTLGMYPPVIGEREKLLSIGPMTRYACDIIPFLKVMAGGKVDELKLDEVPDLSKLKIFYIEDIGDPFAKKCDSEILSAIRNAAEHLGKKYRAVAERITLDEFKYGLHLWLADADAESKTRAPSMAVQFKDGSPGQLNPLVEIIKKLFNRSDHNVSSIISTVLENCTPTKGSENNQMLIEKAVELRRNFNEILGENGILLVPTHPEPAPKRFTTITKLFNISYTSVTTILLGPITQCPLGMSKEGLPFGVQVMSRPFNDRLTIAVAQELEKEFGGWSPPCEIIV